MFLTDLQREAIEPFLNHQRANVFVLSEMPSDRYGVLKELLNSVMPPVDSQESHFLLDSAGQIQPPSQWSTSFSLKQILRMNPDAVALVDPTDDSWRDIFTAIEAGVSILTTLPGRDSQGVFDHYLSTVSQQMGIPLEPIRAGALGKRPTVLIECSSGRIAKIRRLTKSNPTLEFQDL